MYEIHRPLWASIYLAVWGLLAVAFSLDWSPVICILVAAAALAYTILTDPAPRQRRTGDPRYDAVECDCPRHASLVKDPERPDDAV